MKKILLFFPCIFLLQGCTPHELTEPEAKIWAEAKFVDICNRAYTRVNGKEVYCKTNEFTDPEISTTVSGNSSKTELAYCFIWKHKTKNIEVSVITSKSDTIGGFDPIDPKQPIGVVLKEEKFK